jgi:hypothetical protein
MVVPRPDDPGRSAPALFSRAERIASLSSVAYDSIRSPRRALTTQEDCSAGIDHDHPGEVLAAIAAEYVLERARRSSGRRWYQGPRRPPLPFDGDHDALRRFAEHRVCGVGELESRALVGWANGARTADLYDRELDATEIVALQADGRRCVSLLDGPDGLGFALHDLRHLEKFFQAEHHRAQVGFFRIIDRALPRCASLDADLDDAWRIERDRVLADMNGSPIFLFAVLKMKLKVAVRRRFARDHGVPPPERGPLDDRELEAYAPMLERLLDALDLPPPIRAAARSINARRDRPDHARALLDYLEGVGVL